MKGKNLIILVALLFLLTACGIKPQMEKNEITIAEEMPNQETTVQIEVESEEATEEIALVDQDIAFEVEYFKPANGESRLFVIRNTDELRQCFDIIKKEMPDELKKKYNEEWFSSHMLIYLGELMSNGSDLIEVQGIQIKHNQLQLDVFVKPPSWDLLSEERKENILTGKEQYSYSVELSLGSAGAFVAIDREYDKGIEMMEYAKITYLSVHGRVNRWETERKLVQGAEIK